MHGHTHKNMPGNAPAPPRPGRWRRIVYGTWIVLALFIFTSAHLEYLLGVLRKLLAR